MSGGKPSLEVIDRTQELMARIKMYKNDDVLVGIPASDTGRNEAVKGTPINNATLLFINNFGSPVNNIPPRPVMEIGIALAQHEIEVEFKAMLQRSLKQGLTSLAPYFNRIGMIASSSVKRVINEQIGIEGPSDTTLAIRRSGGFHNWLKFGANHDALSFRNKDVKSVGGFMGTKALIVTGQMRNAITWVTKTGAK